MPAVMPVINVSAVQARHPSPPLNTETKVILATAMILSAVTLVLAVLLCVFRRRLLELARLVGHVNRNVDQLRGKAGERMKLLRAVEQKVELLAEESRKRDFSRKPKPPPNPDARYESIEELDPGSVAKITIPKKKAGSKTKWPDARRARRRPANADAGASASVSTSGSASSSDAATTDRRHPIPPRRDGTRPAAMSLQAPKPSLQSARLLRARSRTFPLQDDTSDIQSTAWSENSSSLCQHPVSLRAGPGAVVNVKQQDGRGDAGKDDFRIAVIETMP